MHDPYSMHQASQVQQALDKDGIFLSPQHTQKKTAGLKQRKPICFCHKIRPVTSMHQARFFLALLKSSDL